MGKKNTINNSSCHKIEVEHSYAVGLVSVIIPTYNRAECIMRAIDSVLDQTFKSYEIIVVDDGSTDKTKQVLQPYMDRIRYLYQENSGHASARNTGIRASHGQWIAFLDSDDVWMPEKLARQVEALKHTKARVCYTNAIHNSQGRNAVVENQNCSKEPAQVFDEPFELLLFESGHKYLVTLMVEREILIHVGCFDERVYRHVDVRLCFRLAFETPFAYINQPLAIVDRTVERRGVSTERGFAFMKAAFCGDVITRAEAYFQSTDKRRRIVKNLRHQLGHYLSRAALCLCFENNNRYGARRFALDGLYFGGNWRTYRRCIAVLFFPWLVRKIKKTTENDSK